MATKRMNQVAEEIRHLLANLIATGQASDPRLRMVSISGVEMTPDLQVARVRYTVLGETAEQKAADLGFESAKGFFRREVGRALKLRYTPNLEFRFDPSIAYSAHMNELFFKMREATSIDEGLSPSSSPAYLASGNYKAASQSSEVHDGK